MDSKTQPAKAQPRRLIPFAPYRERVARFERQLAASVAWDSLPRLADDAWCWRDPDALAALEACIAQLKASVLEDWRR